MSEEIPSGINFNRLKKDEILWLYNHECQHRHRYTEHPQCFLDEYGDKLSQAEVIGFVDIEATNLNADFGYILCYSIKGLDSKLKNCSVTPQDIRSYKFDRRVVRQFVTDIEPFDRLVGYYSKDYRFDIPYLRTRALRWGLDFPEYKEFLFTDVYDLVKPKLKLHRNRLEAVCDLLGIPSKEHRLNPDIWQKAQAGSKQALDYISTHCNEDVLSLEAVYKRLHKFGRIAKTSM